MDGIEKTIGKICGDDKFLSYEIAPQKAFSINAILENIKGSELYSWFDAFICTDSPLARLKHSSILAGIKAKNYLQKPIICTISVRDKNSIALQGEILGLNEFDIRIFLALKGDPIILGDQPQAKGVFESDSYMLFDIINALNNRKDLSNLDIKDVGRPIYPLGVINSYSNNMENIYIQMFKKVQRGALALITQPVYDVDNAKQLLLMLERVNKELGKNARLIIGYHPVYSLESVEFLYRKLPGCYIPEHWMDGLKNTNDEKKIGIELSYNLYKELKALYPKIHFMCANNIEIAESIILK